MPKVRSKITRGVIEELRSRAKVSGDNKVLDFLSEVEKTLPKRGRKPGSGYQLDVAIERIRTLVQAGYSFRRASEQASEEFYISVEFLRKEERKRRGKELPMPTTPSIPATSQEKPISSTQIIKRPHEPLTVVSLRESLLRLQELDVTPRVIQTVEMLNKQQRKDIEQIIRSMDSMFQVDTEILDNLDKLAHGLVEIPDWKKIFDKPWW